MHVIYLNYLLSSANNLDQIFGARVDETDFLVSLEKGKFVCYLHCI